MAATQQELQQAAKYIIRLLGGFDTTTLEAQLLGYIANQSLVNAIPVYYKSSKKHKVRGRLDTTSGLLCLVDGKVLQVGGGAPCIKVLIS